MNFRIKFFFHLEKNKLIVTALSPKFLTLQWNCAVRPTAATALLCVVFSKYGWMSDGFSIDEAISFDDVQVSGEAVIKKTTLYTFYDF